MKIKIVSGWSNPGGSTTANVNLCNLFNEKGLDCTFYGPHEWHLDKCKSGSLPDADIGREDIVIVHFMPISVRPPLKKLILAVHEKGLQPLKHYKNLDLFDFVHFINNEQRKWHSVDSPFEVIPNVYDSLVKGTKVEGSEEVAGVIGSFDFNKNTHVSIHRALGDGYKKVLLYGKIVDEDYYQQKVVPMLGDNVIHAGFVEDKQGMYDSISSAYLSSDSEVDPYVRGECALTGTKFYGNENTNYGQLPWSKNRVFKKWKKCLGF